MPAKGWISIREMPSTGNKDVAKILTSFQKTHELCPDCNGTCETQNSNDEFYEGVSTVKYSNIEPLHKMAKNNNLNGETIKRIINKIVHGIGHCNTCKGFGFVKKSRKKKSEKHT